MLSVADAEKVTNITMILKTSIAPNLRMPAFTLATIFFCAALTVSTDIALGGPNDVPVQEVQRMMGMNDYDLLGLTPAETNPESIQMRIKVLRRRYHPDRGNRDLSVPSSQREFATHIELSQLMDRILTAGENLSKLKSHSQNEMKSKPSAASQPHGTEYRTQESPRNTQNGFNPFGFGGGPSESAKPVSEEIVGAYFEALSKCIDLYAFLSKGERDSDENPRELGFREAFRRVALEAANQAAPPVIGPRSWRDRLPGWMPGVTGDPWIGFSKLDAKSLRTFVGDRLPNGETTALVMMLALERIAASEENGDRYFETLMLLTVEAEMSIEKIAGLASFQRIFHLDARNTLFSESPAVIGRLGFNSYMGARVLNSLLKMRLLGQTRDARVLQEIGFHANVVSSVEWGKLDKSIQQGARERVLSLVRTNPGITEKVGTYLDGVMERQQWNRNFDRQAFATLIQLFKDEFRGRQGTQNSGTKTHKASSEQRLDPEDFEKPTDRFKSWIGQWGRKAKSCISSLRR